MGSGLLKPGFRLLARAWQRERYRYGERFLAQPLTTARLGPVPGRPCLDHLRSRKTPIEDAEDCQVFEAAATADYAAKTVVERRLVLRLAVAFAMSDPY